MSNVSQWNVTDASNTAASPNGAPEGWAPSHVNDVVRAMFGALARWYSDSDGTLLSGGTGAAYTLTTNNGHAALGDIPLTVFRVHAANTGACTLNVDSLGAKNLRIAGTNIATASVLGLNELIVVAYNSNADAFDVLGGHIEEVSSGGTGATTAAAARTNLGVQAQDAGLDDISGLAVTDGNIIVGDGANWVAESGATARTSLGVTDEFVEDIVGAMVTGNTETGMTVTYQDGDGTLDFEIDLASLTGQGSTAPAQDDGFIFLDGGAERQYLIRDMRMVSPANDPDGHVFVSTDMNQMRVYSGAGGHTWSINTGIGLKGQAILICNDGTADGPTIGGTATLQSASGNFKVQQNGMAVAVCVGTNIWNVSGDLMA